MVSSGLEAFTVGGEAHATLCDCYVGGGVGFEEANVNNGVMGYKGI